MIPMLFWACLIYFCGPLHAGDDLFTSNIRPFLSTHCFECHGPEKQKGDLRQDIINP